MRRTASSPSLDESPASLTFPLPSAIRIPPSELEERRARLLAAMAGAGIACVVLTARENIEYFSGFRSLSWAYNTRPIFVVVTDAGITLVCSLSERRAVDHDGHVMPVVGYSGYLTEAVEAVAGIVGSRLASGGPIMIDYGQDMLGRGSLELVRRLALAGSPGYLTSATSLIWSLRSIKSAYEANLKSLAFSIANSAFDEVLATSELGITEAEFARALQLSVIAKGAERAEPVTLVFGRGDFSYTRWPSDRRLQIGDYIWTDFRCTYGGYPADRNRIARAGIPSADESETYRRVRGCAIALCLSVRAGERTGDVYDRFLALWADAGLGRPYGLAARIGHGGGLDVGEPPSLASGGTEVIEAGMILHIEPKLEAHGGVFQCEEIIYLTHDGPRFLSHWSPEEIPIVPGT